MECTGSRWTHHFCSLPACIVERIRQLGRLRNAGRQSALSRLGLAAVALDVYDFSHGTLSAVELDDVRPGLLDLGNEPGRLSSDESYSPYRQCGFLLFHLAPLDSRGLVDA